MVPIHERWMQCIQQCVVCVEHESPAEGSAFTAPAVIPENQSSEWLHLFQNRTKSWPIPMCSMGWRPLLVCTLCRSNAVQTEQTCVKLTYLFLQANTPMSNIKDRMQDLILVTSENKSRFPHGLYAKISKQSNIYLISLVTSVTSGTKCQGGKYQHQSVKL